MMKRYIKLLPVLAMSILATGCSMGDAYDSNAKKAEEEANFVDAFGSIASDQTWNTVAQRKASIELSGSSSETYTIDICSSNPATDTNAKSLYQTTAKGGQTITATFDVPANLQRVFVSRAGTNNQYISCAELSADKTTYTCSFAPATVSSAKSATRTSAAVSEDPFTFETVTYPDKAPSYATDASNLNDPNKYQDTKYIVLSGDGKTYSFHMWGGSRNIYVTGKNITLSVLGDQTSLNQANIYVLPGASFNFNCKYNINDCKFYVCKDATMNYNYAKLNNSENAKIYNQGIINLSENFAMGNNAYIYNQGTINASIYDITMNPGDGVYAFLYNVGGIIKAKSLTMSANRSEMYNSGTIEISEKTCISQAGEWWINNGKYTTGSMEVKASNKTCYSNCQLYVTDQLYLHEGEFHVLNGGYVEANEFVEDNNRVYLKDKAAFYVKTKSEFQAQSDGTNNGFDATASSDYCLVKLGGTTTVAEQNQALTFLGNVYYTAQNTIKETTNSGITKQIVHGEGSQGVTYSNTTITPNSDCGSSWSDDGKPKYPETAGYTLACEDLGSTDDFDFNDVVLYLYPSTNTKKMRIDLVAAGGVLPFKVYFNNSTDPIITKTDGVMKNTQSTTKGSVLGTATVTLPEGFTMSDSQYTSMIQIKVNGSNDAYIIHSNTEEGKAPQVLVLGGEWAWPTERTKIDSAYPNFKTWVKDSSTSSWTENPTNGLVVK